MDRQESEKNLHPACPYSLEVIGRKSLHQRGVEMDMRVMVVIPGRKRGERLGLVRFYEMGYYPTSLDDPTWTTEEVEAYARDYNESVGIPADVATSAMEASMFGWHVPAATRAIEFFKAKSLEGSK